MIHKKKRTITRKRSRPTSSKSTINPRPRKTPKLYIVSSTSSNFDPELNYNNNDFYVPLKYYKDTNTRKTPPLLRSRTKTQIEPPISNQEILSSYDSNSDFDLTDNRNSPNQCHLSNKSTSSDSDFNVNDKLPQLQNKHSQMKHLRSTSSENSGNPAPHNRQIPNKHILSDNNINNSHTSSDETLVLTNHTNCSKTIETNKILYPKFFKQSSTT